MEILRKNNPIDWIRGIDWAEAGNKLTGLIPESWKKMDTWAMLFRRLVYIACFAWLMYLDHIIGSAYGNIQFGMKNYTGVVFAIIVLTAYKARDFIKIPYAVWVVLFFILRPSLISYLSETDWLTERVESTVWNIGIYGIVFIRMFYLYVIERKKPNMNWPLFAIWLIMMGAMIFSQNDGTWYYWFLLIFGVFYLTNYNQKQLNCLFSGMVEGMILGFCYIQWQACLYRPYDELRYEGMYANCNINALFYTVSYLAVLGKWYLLKLKKRPFILKIPCVLLCGCLWALSVFTMCRTALITMAITTAAFIGFQFISRKKRKFIELFTNTALVLFSIFFLFEPTYNIVRYLPAYTNSPIYFVGEEPEKKIQEDEAIDSEKYTDYEEMLEAAFGRVTLLKEALSGRFGSVGNVLLPVLQVSAAESISETARIENQVVSDELLGTSEAYPILTREEADSDPLAVRMSIYKYYWKRLNLKGHTAEEHGVWLIKDYYAPHAHNIWLQITFDHGWIAGAAFAFLLTATLVIVLKNLIVYRQGAVYYRMFVVLGILILILSFGMLEMCWIYGQIPMTLLFVAFRTACHKDEQKKMK